MDPHRARKLENHLGGGKSRELLISPDLRHSETSFLAVLHPEVRAILDDCRDLAG
jgi:hypothetical protein